MSKVVVISGGGTGIGYACAQYYAKQEMQVVILGRRMDTLSQAAANIAEAFPKAPAVLALTADLSIPEQAQNACDVIRQEFKTVDTLINAAGSNAIRRAPAGSYADGLAGVARRWNDNFQNNTLSAVLLTEGIRPILKRPGGSVILISSIAAYRGSSIGCYAAAKAALHPYCYDLAAALSPEGITVNAVAPGYVQDTEFFGAALSPEQQKSKQAEALNGRGGTPQDVANAIAWLTSAEAGHITAQIIQINGGAEKGR
ncbi:SDR family NAD(P)-dependent oxidoreductase [Chromobacterium vaccinii]|uniref:SDR family NAD(P)-dependent oxidoreductase n=1 Tax=Chromobacterium vaccinii TaxID=1108595 RepID=UPI0006181944|nr:SDR family oxidoreductase [Chromobacterium vaccinii]